MRKLRGMRLAITTALAVAALVPVIALAGCGSGADVISSLITVDSDGKIRVQNPVSVPSGLTDADVKPIVDTIEPTSGTAGTAVTIHGKNFTNRPGGVFVAVVGAKNILNAQVVNDTTITGTIPQQQVCGGEPIGVATAYGTSGWDASHPDVRFSYICATQ